MSLFVYIADKVTDKRMPMKEYATLQNGKVIRLHEGGWEHLEPAERQRLKVIAVLEDEGTS